MFRDFARPPRAAARHWPVVATLLLTAAIFVLPATGNGVPARASAGDIKLSATHMSDDAGMPAVRK